MTTKLSGKKVRSLITADAKAKLARERGYFLAWWSTYNDRDAASMKAAWNAWKKRAGL